MLALPLRVRFIALISKLDSTYLFGDFASSSHFVLCHNFLEVLSLLDFFFLLLICFNLLLCEPADSSENVWVNRDRLRRQFFEKFVY
jgi:hypothetical protein